MKTKILLVIIICVLIRLFFCYPLNNNLLWGGDFDAHYFRVWFVSNYDLDKWNYYWYGGHSFLNDYPPLSYLIVGILGKLIGPLISYKLIINVFYVLAPIIFYLFLTELKLSEREKIVSLVFFTLILIYPYYYSKGAYATIVNLCFLILYWKFLKRSIDTKKLKDIIISSIFLGFSILTHHLTTILIIPISLTWLIMYSPKKQSLFYFIKIWAIAILISSWWLIPFIIKSIFAYQGGQFFITPFFSIDTTMYSFFGYPQYILGAFIVFIFIFSLIRLKNKKIRIFLLTTIVAITMLILPYKRVFVLIPLPLSVFVSEVLALIPKKVRNYIILILFLFLFISYISVKKYEYPFSEIPKLPKGYRAIYFTENANLWNDIILPMNGNEYISGWYTQSQYFEKNAKEKIEYTKIIDKGPLGTNKEKYYEVLNAGWVNYVVVDKNYNDLINYFNSSKNFQIINTTKNFTVFRLNPESTYVEINNKSVNCFPIKQNDKIILEFKCNVGEATIKESYNDFWEGTLSGKKIELSYNYYGFIKTYINESGNCTLVLEFKEPPIYIVFKVVSIITIIILLVITIKLNKSRKEFY